MKSSQINLLQPRSDQNKRRAKQQRKLALSMAMESERRGRRTKGRRNLCRHQLPCSRRACPGILRSPSEAHMRQTLALNKV